MGILTQRLSTFLSECHFEVLSFPLDVGPAALLPGKAVSWKVPLPWRARYSRFIGGIENAPWWQGMERSKMSEVMEQIMKSKIVLFDGVQSDLVLDPEFARHIGHLAEYAPLDG